MRWALLHCSSALCVHPSVSELFRDRVVRFYAGLQHVLGQKSLDVAAAPLRLLLHAHHDLYVLDYYVMQVSIQLFLVCPWNAKV